MSLSCDQCNYKTNLKGNLSRCIETKHLPRHLNLNNVKSVENVYHRSHICENIQKSVVKQMKPDTLWCVFLVIIVSTKLLINDLYTLKQSIYHRNSQENYWKIQKSTLNQWIFKISKNIFDMIAINKQHLLYIQSKHTSGIFHAINVNNYFITDAICVTKQRKDVTRRKKYTKIFNLIRISSFNVTSHWSAY